MFKVLLVDDEPRLTGVIKDYLKSFNLHNPKYFVVTAKNITEAIEATANHKLDIAFIDIIMPGTNPQQEGFDFLKHLKEHQPNCKAYIWSGKPTDHNINMAKELGAVEFIPKPFTGEDITNRIEATGPIWN